MSDAEGIQQLKPFSRARLAALDDPFPVDRMVDAVMEESRIRLSSNPNAFPLAGTHWSSCSYMLPTMVENKLDYEPIYTVVRN